MVSVKKGHFKSAYKPHPGRNTVVCSDPQLARGLSVALAHLHTTSLGGFPTSCCLGVDVHGLCSWNSGLRLHALEAHPFVEVPVR